MKVVHKKQIRSFICRAGRMSLSQRQALLTYGSVYSLPVDKGILDFDHFFGRSAPRVLEIGFGMGQSLLSQAQQCPEQDYIGVEMHKPGIGAVVAGIAKHELTNIRIFHGDAVDILAQCVAENSLTAVQIFFPDPWPKRRHFKRRLIQSAFVNLLGTKLKTGGHLLLATDWEDYAQQMLTVISANSAFKNLAGENQFAPRLEERLLTKFEARGQRLGHNVWDLAFQKV